MYPLCKNHFVKHLHWLKFIQLSGCETSASSWNEKFLQSKHWNVLSYTFPTWQINRLLREIKFLLSHQASFLIEFPTNRILSRKCLSTNSVSRLKRECYEEALSSLPHFGHILKCWDAMIWFSFFIVRP